MTFIREHKKKNGSVYLSEVENCRVNGKIKQKHIRYVGKKINGKTILSSSISNIEIESVRIYGQLIVLHHLAQEINLSKILGEYGDEILSLVYAHCVEPKSLNQMENWFKKTDLNFILNLENLTEARLIEALDSIKKQGTEKLQKNIFNELKLKYDVDTSAILYDVTNTYFYGKKCIWGKKGKSKDKQKDKPLIQVGLAITRKDGFPVFHEPFEGNIHDARTLQCLIPVFQEYNIKDATLVYDRGIPSIENISDIKTLGWETICGLPIHDYLKPQIRKIIKQKEFVNVKNRVKLTNTTMYTVPKMHQIGTTCGTLVVCFDNKRKVAIQESRYDEIQNAQKRLREKKNIKNGLGKYFDKNENIIQSKIKEAEEFDGYSCLYSSKNLPTEEIVRIYFEKDLVEKAFQSLKGVIALRPIRFWLYDKVEEHIFICYLAYLLLSLLKHKLKKIDIQPIEALQELDSLYKVYMRDTEKNFKLTKIVKLTKKQEDILRAIDKKLLKM